MDELKIRFDSEDHKYYVYLVDTWGHCSFQSDPFDTLEEAKAVKQDQEDSAEFGEEK